MSKSALKAEDIFFGLQKTNQNKNKAIEEAKKKAAEETKAEPQAENTPAEEAEAPKKKPAAPKKKAAGETKRRGPAPKPENERRVPINIQVSPELKYSATALVNEMKMRGLKESYTLTDFVAEAIDEKIKRMKKQLDSE